jgi:hypothetical protein
MRLDFTASPFDYSVGRTSNSIRHGLAAFSSSGPARGRFARAMTGFFIPGVSHG